MKRIFIGSLLLAVVTFSCNNAENRQEEERYTQNSEEINTLKAAISDYEKGDWESMKSHYADTAQIFHNSSEGQNINSVINAHKESLQGLEEYSLEDEDEDYEMVVTDDGHTWVNYWGDWQTNISGSKINVPVHLTARFENGKIVREYGYWDNSIMMMAMQEADTTKTDTIK